VEDGLGESRLGEPFCKKVVEPSKLVERNRCTVVVLQKDAAEQSNCSLSC
jgi:hypothetical protein